MGLGRPGRKGDYNGHGYKIASRRKNPGIGGIHDLECVVGWNRVGLVFLSELFRVCS